MRASAFPALAALQLAAAVALGESSMRLTLRDAVLIALRPGQRADTDLAMEAVARAQSVAKAEMAALLPLVETRLSAGERSVNLRSQGLGGSDQDVPLQLNPSFTTFDVRPSVSVTLLDLGQWKAWRASREESLRTVQERDAALDGAALNVATLYLSGLEAQAGVTAAEAAAKLSRELLAAADQRLRAGTVTVVDLTRARSQEAADQSALLAARQAEREARAALFHAMGIDWDSGIELLPPSEGRLVPSLTLDEALKAAEDGRADLRARKAAVGAAAARAGAVDRERLPRLTGSFDIGRNGTTPSDAEWTRNATVTLSLTLFDSGRRGQRKARAEIAMREEQIRLRDLRREIARQVRVAVGSVSSARALVDAAHAERDLAALQIEQVRERALVGLATGLDLADAQARSADSMRSLLKAEYGLQLAGVQLLSATGRLRQRLLEP